MNVKVKLSTLWIAIMMNMIFADILSIMVELVNKNTLQIPGNIETAMGVAAIFINIPILMIYFSRVLNYKINRTANIVASFITLVFIVGGGSTTPHYIICAGIETILLTIIVWTAWKWVDIIA